MVWFPGGAFLVGSASTYEGSELAAREKVVLVFLQYRLGILGFFRWALDRGGAFTYLPETQKVGELEERGVVRGRDRVKRVVVQAVKTLDTLSRASLRKP